MDELVIGDKKYLSSKQAAKVTGYAKDYIGQLCREGRVPARLVGRSWYVLESAIHDHRFGDQKTAQEVQKESLAVESVLPPTWEAPRYEASSVEEESIPAVNRSDSPKDADSQHLQDSWKEWFDRIADASIATPPAPKESEEESKEEEVAEVEREAEEAEEVAVPIHAVYHKPPEELLPRRAARDPYEAVVSEPELQIVNPYEPEASRQRVGKARLILQTAGVQTAGGLFALAMAILAVFGTGYFDEYIISHNQVGAVAGVSFYNR